MRATPLPIFKQARRDSNPQPPVLETGALPVELRTSDIQRLPSIRCTPLQSYSGQGRNRTTDTTIFSRVLYQLSYLARTKVPPPREKKPPGLSATGGSASTAVDILKKHGCRDIRFLCLVCAPEGVERLQREQPEVPVYTAALDRQLDENGYIRPGLGDAGDRIFGTQ